MRACQVFVGETLAANDEEFAHRLGDLANRLPATRSPVERLVRRAFLVEMSMRRLGGRDLRLLRHSLVASGVLDPSPRGVNANGSQQARAAVVRALIERQYQQPLTLSTVSRQLHEHRNVVARSFKQTYGMSFRQYLVEQRITAAIDLLRTTVFNIDAIAGMVGYRSKKNFYTEFERLVGLTPAAFRSQNAG